MRAKRNLANVGLVALKLDGCVFHLINIAERVGLYHRIGMLTENGGDIESWRVDRMIERNPHLTNEAYIQLLERLRRIHGEITKCEALIEEADKSFPRNTTKEPQ